MSFGDLKDLFDVGVQLVDLLLVPLVGFAWKSAKHQQRVEDFMKNSGKQLDQLDTLTRRHDTSIARLQATLRTQEER
jgi:hypothetical protein